MIPMEAQPRLLSIACSEAPFPVSQEEVKSFALRQFPTGDSSTTLASVFENASVLWRTISAPLRFFERGVPFAVRNRIYQETSRKMLGRAACAAVPEKLRPEITHIVLVSTTGLSTPSLECGVMEDLEIWDGARRVPVFGLGCAGGAAGLQLARDLAQSDPRNLILLLCVELTSLTYWIADKSPKNFVACSLFGDGAAAALIGNPREDLPGVALLGPGATRLFRESRRLMGWEFQEDGWEVIFGRDIPRFVLENIRSFLESSTGLQGLRHFAIHPGGRKILDAYQQALDLPDSSLDPSASVLARHGNMSAATVFFVIREILSRPDYRPGPGVLTAFGPGFSAEAMRIEFL